MEELVLQALEYGLPILMGTVLTWLLAKLGQFINAKVKNEYLAGTLVRLKDAVHAAVSEVSQSYVDGLKAGRSPNSADGSKLTHEEKQAAKKKAVDAAKSYLGKKGLKELAKVFGLKADAALDEFLGGQVEKAVRDSSPLKEEG